ncbi:MAG: polyprenyl synthetase family protein [Acholeplasmatales bacterium]|nr:MAG: polyprenyl synthetase family protein [Acholeplasmatales bacterium]
MSKHWIAQLEDRLKYHVNQPGNPLSEPMIHALLSGGKRLRPRLFMTTLAMFGFAPEAYLDVACALEMVHTYSLVHDDLPAMDDDTLRRGQPTVHVAFDEATAILTGDALLTDAFLLLARTQAIPSDVRVKLVAILAEKAGSTGMVAGQVLDMESTHKTLDVDALETMHQLKTAALLEAALMMAGAIAGLEDLSQLEQCGRALGLAFQIQDDLLDAQSTPEHMGKSLSDAAHDKASYVRMLGLEASKRACGRLFASAKAACAKLGVDAEALSALITTIEQRTA